MKKYMIAIILIISSFSVYSQGRKVEKLEIVKSPNIKWSYSSRLNLQNPGVNVGAEFMVGHKKVSFGNFIRTKQRFLTINTSVFREPNLYDNIAVYAELLKRTYFKKSGFFLEHAAGFGAGKAINYKVPSTYLRDANGVETIKKPKNNFIAINLVVGAGYDFQTSQNKPIKIFAKAGIYPILLNASNFNNYIKTEVGLITNLSIFKRK